jgi:putative transposase
LDCLSGGRARSPGSTARPSGTGRAAAATATTRCASGCGGCRPSTRAGDTGSPGGVVRQEGWAVNHKKIQRLWRGEGLRVPQRKRKRYRLGESTVTGERLRAERPDHVWALDFQFDITGNGRTLKLLHVVDEFTREALAIRVARSIDADHTVRVLDEIVRERGSGPKLVRMDNGPELTANALRDWCRFGGPGRSYIEPGSPWENPFVESFGSRVRDEGERGSRRAEAVR